MRKSILLLIAICSALQLPTTMQAYNKIFHNGKATYVMRSTPFLSYFEQHPDAFPPRNYTVELPDGSKETLRPLRHGMYGGDIGTYQIIDGKLMVKDIQVESVIEKDGVSSYSRKSVMNYLFPDSTQVHANWFTGVLTLADGEFLKYDYEEAKFSHYILLKIENGNVLRKFRLTAAQYEEYRKSWFWKEQQIEEFYRPIEEYETQGSFFLQNNVPKFIISYP